MARRVPGNPMGSILRDIDRRTRTTTRRARPAARTEPDEQPTEPEPVPVQTAPKPPTPWGVAAFTLVTGEDGGVQVEFPRPFASPVVVASVIGSASAVAVVDEVTSSHAYVSVLRGTDARRAPGSSVHVIVTEATG
ncbi:hypothetical protein E0L36_21850 [Streptomyces sp. AJS327]|uniref:hypothetical protein n=1 Tax=Streptomyces sp. AJS327 TaxID=2545265 RepID=UPI0015E05338|nr:hypothetical protein [Streptomyces sp. AJS327]MBA0053421.1 hypothetical protein [Streptomyces sp. AJS327]